MCTGGKIPKCLIKNSTCLLGGLLRLWASPFYVKSRGRPKPGGRFRPLTPGPGFLILLQLCPHNSLLLFFRSFFQIVRIFSLCRVFCLVETEKCFILFDCAGFKVTPFRLTVGKRITQIGAHLLADRNCQNLCASAFR